MNFWEQNIFQLNKLVQRLSFHSIYEAWVAQEMRKRVVQLYTKKQCDIFFSMEYHLLRQLKRSCFEFFGDEEYGIFEPKSLAK